MLAQFLESNLEHVSNKSAYLCGVMKTYRQKSRAAGHAQVRLYLVTNLLSSCSFPMVWMRGKKVPNIAGVIIFIRAV